MLTREEDLNINAPKPMPKNYIFVYELGKVGGPGEIRGHQAACRSVDEISNLPISKMNAAEVRSGWIKFANTRNHKRLNQIQEAKWVLRFPKGNQAIDGAWQKLVELVKNDTLWDIKATAINDKFETQIICVYVADPNDYLEIIQVYDVLYKHGLLELHMAQAINDTKINFITDEDTRLNNSAPKFTSDDIKDLHKLFELKDTVSDDMFKKRWMDFVDALKFKLKENKLPNNFVSTCYSIEEATNRLDLLMKLDKFQQQNSVSDLLVLGDIFKKIRSTLTSNYKFTAAELLMHGKSLLAAACPEKGLVELLMIWKKNPNIVKFEAAILFLEKLIDGEQKSLAPNLASSAAAQPK